MRTWWALVARERRAAQRGAHPHHPGACRLGARPPRHPLPSPACVCVCVREMGHSLHVSVHGVNWSDVFPSPPRCCSGAIGPATAAACSGVGQPGIRSVRQSGTPCSDHSPSQLNTRHSRSAAAVNAVRSQSHALRRTRSANPCWARTCACTADATASACTPHTGQPRARSCRAPRAAATPSRSWSAATSH